MPPALPRGRPRPLAAGGVRSYLGLSAGLLLILLAPAFAAETPPPPASALSGLVKKLAEKRAAENAAKPTRAQLLRPEFRFQPTSGWLVLPDLARQLTTNDTEREAVLALLDQGAREARKLLAAEGEGADRDVAVATSLFITQVWGLVRQTDLPEANADALHAQIVQAIAGPEVGRMSDADKQRFWEFCLGFQVFLLGMKEVATEPAAQEDLRKIAAAAFESLVGVNPHLVDLGPQGMVERAGLHEAARRVREEPGAVAPAPTPAAGPGVDSITYTPPAGWARENAAWAAIFRATLRDVDDRGQPKGDSDARHAGSIFVLPPRAMTGDARTTFEAVWQEQLGAFELGDTIVHYRSRLRSGLVIHYMGRFLTRKGAPEGAMRNYAVVYLVDLGGNRVQPISAVVMPVDPSLGMNTFKEDAALRALAWPLAAVLDSVQPAGGKAPYPAGGYFAARDLQGNWRQSSSAFGGFYVNAATGASAGAAVHSSAGTFRLGTDGTYEYSFGFSTYNPQFGRQSASERHEGRYRLNGDIVLVEPVKPPRAPFTCCAVGVGTRRTADGVKRILVTVSAANDGTFRAPPTVPNWDNYDGVLSWYQEQ